MAFLLRSKLFGFAVDPWRPCPVIPKRRPGGCLATGPTLTPSPWRPAPAPQHCRSAAQRRGTGPRGPTEPRAGQEGIPPPAPRMICSSLRFATVPGMRLRNGGFRKRGFRNGGFGNGGFRNGGRLPQQRRAHGGFRNGSQAPQLLVNRREPMRNPWPLEPQPSPPAADSFRPPAPAGGAKPRRSAPRTATTATCTSARPPSPAAGAAGAHAGSGADEPLCGRAIHPALAAVSRSPCPIALL